MVIKVSLVLTIQRGRKLLFSFSTKWIHLVEKRPTDAYHISKRSELRGGSPRMIRFSKKRTFIFLFFLGFFTYGMLKKKIKVWGHFLWKNTSCVQINFSAILSILSKTFIFEKFQILTKSQNFFGLSQNLA